MKSSSGSLTTEEFKDLPTPIVLIKNLMWSASQALVYLHKTIQNAQALLMSANPPRN